MVSSRRGETYGVSFQEPITQRTRPSSSLPGLRRRNRRAISTETLVIADTDAQQLEDEIRRHEQQGTTLPTVPRSDVEACFPDRPAD